MADEANDTQAPESGADKTIPYTRFKAVVDSKNDLAAKVTDLEGQLQTLSEKAATVDTLATQVQEWKGKAEQAETRFSTFQTISGALGTTDAEGVEAAEWAYGRLPQEDRPELGDWLTGLKDDPTKAPKVLHPWLAQESSGNEGSGDTEAPKSKPKGTGSSAQPPGAPSQVSADEFRRAREHGVKTGDWSKYKQLRKVAGFAT